MEYIYCNINEVVGFYILKYFLQWNISIVTLMILDSERNIAGVCSVTRHTASKWKSEGLWVQYSPMTAIGAPLWKVSIGAPLCKVSKSYNTICNVLCHRWQIPIKWRVEWMEVSDWILPTVSVNSCTKVAECIGAFNDIHMMFFFIQFFSLSINNKI